MIARPETSIIRPRTVHLLNSIGNTAVSGTLSGVTLGLIEKQPEVGLYVGAAALPLIALTAAIAVAAWKAVFDRGESQL